jgi:hypothetical protein
MAITASPVSLSFFIALIALWGETTSVNVSNGHIVHPPDDMSWRATVE